MSKATKKKTADNSPANNIETGTATFEGQLKPDFVSSLEELFVADIKDTYWAENHLVKSLPRMIAAVGSAELKAALKEHLELTKTHSSRLEEVLEMLGEDIVAKKCDAMEGLTMSGEHAIENTMGGSETRDAAIIMSGLKVENFEITTYTGLIKTANRLGKREIAQLLQQTMEEEAQAADILTGILDAFPSPVE